jgi:cardiolipin synthase (CMP-forming)
MTVPPARRVATAPNALSLLRILAIPVFVALIVDRDTTSIGVIVFAVVSATDWLDGVVARATGQVSELGAILDPVADRLAIAAALIALVIRGVFPVWAAVALLVRDAVVIVVGLALLGHGVRIEVRFLGKVATFTLMAAIGAIAWGSLGYAPASAALAVGWAAYGVGLLGSYAVAAWYLRDAREAIDARP